MAPRWSVYIGLISRRPYRAKSSKKRLHSHFVVYFTREARHFRYESRPSPPFASCTHLRQRKYHVNLQLCEDVRSTQHSTSLESSCTHQLASFPPRRLERTCTQRTTSLESSVSQVDALAILLRHTQASHHPLHVKNQGTRLCCV